VILLTRAAQHRGRSSRVRRLAERLHGHRPRGPEAVRDSLTRGLSALGRPFVIDPAPGPPAAAIVGVLSNLAALEEAIAWRRDGTVDRLVAGPNLVVLPSDAPALMSAPEIDVCLVPSQWVKDLYESDSPALIGRVAVWPAGVDTHRWAPVAHSGRRAVIYEKALPDQSNAPRPLIAAARRALEAAGFEVDHLQYGDFGPKAYRRTVCRADVMVFFSPTESQCLAQIEAWAADVPTLVWDRGRLFYKGTVYAGSSSPYLSAATGRAFSGPDDLEGLLANWDHERSAMTPREWVLAQMTDRICAERYLRLATGE
jgi:hypothetical protein